jgi:hypothetical protein
MKRSISAAAIALGIGFGLMLPAQAKSFYLDTCVPEATADQTLEALAAKVGSKVELVHEKYLRIFASTLGKFGGTSPEFEPKKIVIISLPNGGVAIGLFAECGLQQTDVLSKEQAEAHMQAILKSVNA